MNLRNFNQPLILAGERSGLLTRIRAAKQALAAFHREPTEAIRETIC